MSSFTQICGVICEYNPFHNGHRHLLRQIHAENGAVVAVMSGSFVQRGEPAIVAKQARVQMALLGGADLVLELPAIWACAGAEYFAAGGVAILNALGCVDTLWYGSEHPDVTTHIQLATLLQSPEFSDVIRAPLQTGCTFAAARMQAIAHLTDPAAAQLLRSPNDTLGIEYVKALQQQGSTIQPRPIARIGAAHDSTVCEHGICSASYIREAMHNGALPTDGIPAECLPPLQNALAEQGGPADPERLARPILARLRTISPAHASALPEISEGLEYRLLQAARSADSLAALYSLCKTRRYTHARIRRIALAALLGITAEDRAKLPPYIRVLGLNDRGRAVLRTARHTTVLPIITRPTETRALDIFAQHVFSRECTASDLWALSTPCILPADREFTSEVVYQPLLDV